MSLLTRQLDAHAQALDLLAQRQRVLASNIANADTPGFQARDFDFAGALAQARATLHAAGAAPQRPTDPQLQWRVAMQPAMDGNTVDLDGERARFADNALRYEATLRFAQHDLRTLMSAITGQ